MEPKEVIEELKHQFSMLPNEPPHDYVGNEGVWHKENDRIKEALKQAILAMEKQAPKSPYIDNENGIYETEFCPTCFRRLFPNEHHCRCGQAIIWD